MADFTLLMAVYADDNETFVRDAYASATIHQTLPPTKKIVVRDGSVSDELECWLDDIQADPSVTVLRLPENLGLAAALNIGLTHIETEIVARADADDISVSDRFALQIPLVESGFDLVGSAVAEFTTSPSDARLVRPVATSQTEIERQARLESPFHHPSVVFRKTAVLDVGGYPALPRMEDYLLWTPMLMHGAKVTNVNRVLVYYRVGAGAFNRRGGRVLARSESLLQHRLLELGFITRFQYLRNRVLRGPLYRRMPACFRRHLYHLWKARSPHDPEPVPT